MELAGAADGLSAFTGALFRRLLEVVAQFHLAEQAFALKLFLERLQGLVDIVIANDDLQASLQKQEIVRTAPIIDERWSPRAPRGRVGSKL